MRESTGWKRGVRSNALWGSGSRGESRKNALWGSGGRDGRRFAMAALVALTLVVPLSAGADNGSDGKGKDGKGNGTYISPGLLENAGKNPNQKLHVIIQSTGGASGAADSVNGLGADIRRRLQSAGAVAVDITAGKLSSLAKKSGLTITPDSTVKLSGAASSTQLWPYTSGLAYLWGSNNNSAPQAPTIAVVDSGIEAKRADFDWGSRVAAQVNLASTTPNSPGDGRGHGTFVAGIAAGSAAGASGGAPNAKIVSLDVMDDTGTARTSDVIAACDWILANKGTYNIRVANFSLHSGARANFYNDPLDRAVEKLWLNNAVVGVGLHRGRLLEARDRRSRPLHDRGGSDGLDARRRAPGSRRLTGLHGAVGNLLRGPGRGGCGGAGPGAASGLDAGSGEGRIDVDGTVAPERRARIARRRRGQCLPRGDADICAEPESRAAELRHQRPAVRRSVVAGHGAGERLVVRRVLGGRLVGGRLVERSFLGGCFVGRRLLGGCFVG